MHFDTRTFRLSICLLLVGLILLEEIPLFVHAYSGSFDVNYRLHDRLLDELKLSLIIVAPLSIVAIDVLRAKRLKFSAAAAWVCIAVGAPIALYMLTASSSSGAPLLKLISIAVYWIIALLVLFTKEGLDRP